MGTLSLSAGSHRPDVAQRNSKTTMSPALQQLEPSLLTLPPRALHLIIQHAADIPGGTLIPSTESLNTIVTLCRTSQALRTATAAAIHQLRFHTSRAWPSVKVLGPHAWPALDVLDVTVDRSSMLAFLKWLIPATPTELRLRVVGEPYARDRLSELERVLLGRLFTNSGAVLRVLCVEGINCQSLLFSAMFQCTALRHVEIKDYGDASPPALISVMSIICLANREWLEKVDVPWQEWRNRMTDKPDGQEYTKACMITWQTLWRSFRAGMKESAMNLPSGEEELVAKYKQVSARMDALSDRMDSVWKPFQAAGKGVPADDVPSTVLRKLVPKLSGRAAEPPQ